MTWRGFFSGTTAGEELPWLATDGFAVEPNRRGAGGPGRGPAGFLGNRVAEESDISGRAN